MTIPCKSSEEVARFMYETICIFGAFDSPITDQGREFINVDSLEIKRLKIHEE
jgi:hypothetical protein